MPYSYRSTSTSSRGGYGGNRRKSGGGRNNGAQYIDPRRFIATATAQTAAPYETKHSFADFALHEILHNNLTAKGYETPSPIQDQAIMIGLAGRDVIGLAGTGTGKTAAFALPLLQRLITEQDSAAIIIAPTRELAQQIEEECRGLARGSGLSGALLIGGMPMRAQLRELQANPRIVIGTPGRIKDHFQRGTLKLNRFNIVVLDEVDRMLDMGFVQDIREIINMTNPDRQSLFFSATLDPKVRGLIDTFTKNPEMVKIEQVSASENVHQDVVQYAGNYDKLDKLHNLLLQDDITKAIVFDETQRSVERLAQELQARGFSSESIHGGKTQGQRQRALDRFKKNEIKILVATDVAARGIDVADITHVINYSVPRAYDDYVHRIGRAGRAGRIGYALTFVSH